MSGTSGRPGRYQRSPGGLVTAMVVLVAGIVAFVVLRSCTREVPDDGVDAVDFAPVATQARQAGLLAPGPSPLPQGWKATSVRFTPPDPDASGVSGSWHLGLLTAQQRYVAVEETPGDVTDLLDQTVTSPTRGPSVRLDGRTWRSWSGTKGSYALTSAVPGGRQVLVGSPAGEELVDDVVGLLRLPSGS